MLIYHKFVIKLYFAIRTIRSNTKLVIILKNSSVHLVFIICFINYLITYGIVCSLSCECFLLK